MAGLDDAAQAQPDTQTQPPTVEGMLSALPSSRRVRMRPWWFPTQELRNPLVLYLETWLADCIFHPDRTLIPELEWMYQALLRVDSVGFGDLAEVTVFGRPSVQNRVRSILLDQASWHRERRAQQDKIKLLVEFLKLRASIPETLSSKPNTTESSGML